MLINFSKKIFRKTRLNVISEWPKETVEPSYRAEQRLTCQHSRDKATCLRQVMSSHVVWVRGM